MAQKMRILNPTGNLPKNIILSGKGVAKVNVSGDIFSVCPIEDYSHQGVAPSSF